LLSVLALTSAGRFSDTLSFNGNAINDFTLNGQLRKGVIELPDKNFGTSMLFFESIYRF
jgi:hypothetical protein